MAPTIKTPRRLQRLHRSSPRVAALVISVLLSLFGAARSQFDFDFCNSYTKGGTETTWEPNFFDGYAVKAETIVTNDRGGVNVFQESVIYSQSEKKFLFESRGPRGKIWLRADAQLDEILFSEGPLECASSTFSDFKFSFLNVFHFFNPGESDGSVVLASPAESFRYNALKQRKKVTFGEVSVRGLPAFKYVTCDYDEDRDETKISEWFVRPKSRTFTDGPTVIRATHVGKFSDGIIAGNLSTDYYEFRRLSTSELTEDLKIPENKCGVVESPTFQKAMPMPDDHFSLIKELVEYTKRSEVPVALVYVSEEYDFNSGLFVTSRYQPSETSDEKVKRTRIEDYNTGMLYVIDETYGTCLQAQVDSRRRFESKKEDGTYTMKTPYEFWGINVSSLAYEGEFVNKGVPSDTWRSQVTQGSLLGFTPTVTNTIYLASKDWLRERNYPPDTFYPIQVIKRGKYIDNFEAIYEYKPNPGYNTPDVSQCFNHKETVSVQFSLSINYYLAISNFELDFEKHVRAEATKIMGIASPLRVAQIEAAPSKVNPEESIVFFKILGGISSENEEIASYKEREPITSNDAARKLNDAIDAGTFKIPMKTPKGTFSVTAKAYSLAYKDTSYRLNFFDVIPPASQAGGRGGDVTKTTMAVAGLLMFFVGLVLGLAGVLLYKRFMVVTMPTELKPGIDLTKIGEEQT